MSSIPTTHTTAQLHGLGRLVAPSDVESFLRDHLGERMLYASGPADRWADLFSWQSLNNALNQQLIAHPRVRLAAEGADVPPSLFTYERNGARWPDSVRCHQLMAQGATLMLTNIECLTPRLELFVRELARDLRADVRVDLVATCASTPGLKMHWDNAECFNLQLDGEKDWQVVRPERLYPLTATHRYPERKDVITSKAPEAPPEWSGTVAPGALIYLPRGWWHLVTPKKSPSLHLSIAVDLPTYSDFLLWLARESPRLDTARRTFPLWRSAAERRTSTAAALAELQSLLTVESVESYIAHVAASTHSHADFSLPRAAAPEGPRLEPSTRVRLQSAGPLDWTTAGEVVTIAWQGQTFRFSTRVLPALRKLERMDAVTIDELCEGTDRMLTHALVLSFVTAGLLSETSRRDTEAPVLADNTPGLSSEPHVTPGADGIASAEFAVRP